MTLLMLMKSQPLAYNKDNQEDKEPLFDTVDALGDCLRAMINLLPEIEVQKEALYSAAKESFSTATDLADYLVRKNIPFREAHEIVGRSVAYGLEQGLELSCMPLAKLQEFSPQIQADVYEVLSVEGSVTSRAHVGGTAPESVKAAAGRARHRLKNR
jgi:argininosuccinate lyase